MKIRILGCYGAETPGYKTTCFMINDSSLVDAGTITSVLSPKEQSKIKNIFITHSHIDHVKDIPLLADNLAGEKDHTVNIFSIGEVLDILRNNLFNNKLWPDFSVIPTKERPVLRFNEVTPGIPFLVDGLKVTAVEVNHTVPTIGYLIDDGRGAVAISGDTGPTERFWDAVNNAPNVKGLFLETSFPNEMADIAGLSLHLTPEMAVGEVNKLRNKDIPVYLYHLKPNYLDVLQKELSRINHHECSILKMDDVLEF